MSPKLRDMAPLHIYEIFQCQPEDITDLLNNSRANNAILSAPQRALTWNVKGALPMIDLAISSKKNQACMQSMVAFIYGKKYEVRCGTCEFGSGNHKDCVGFCGGDGTSPLANGACANCIQQSKSPACEWNQISGPEALPPSDRYRPVSKSEWQRRWDFVIKLNKHYMEIGSSSVVEPPPAWGGGIAVMQPSPMLAQLAPQPQVARQGSSNPSFEGDLPLLPDPEVTVNGGNTYIRTHVRGLLVNKYLQGPALRTAVRHLEAVLEKECGEIVSTAPPAPQIIVVEVSDDEDDEEAEPPFTPLPAPGPHSTQPTGPESQPTKAPTFKTLPKRVRVSSPASQQAVPKRTERKGHGSPNSALADRLKLYKTKDKTLQERQRHERKQMNISNVKEEE